MKTYDPGRLRILAVDDEPSILELYQDSLSYFSKKNGHEKEFDITLCSQGDEALLTVKDAMDNDDPFSVIFLDLNMPPGPDGIWTGEQIRKIDPFVNFIVVTGLNNVDSRAIAKRIPPEDKFLYVQKPFHVLEIRQFTTAISAKWQAEMLLRKTNMQLENKVAELEYSRKELLNNKAELEDLANQLIETNTALSVLAKNLDRTRKESEKRVLQRTRTLILPVIEKLQQEKNLKKYQTDLNLLTGYISNLTSGFANDIKIAVSLSSSELRVASLIKSGMTSDDIARHLYISPSTVKTHRKNIRKKLNMQNSKINLKVYLQEQFDS